MRRVVFAALASAALVPGTALARPAEKPNIVFIMADDMGYADLSSYGAQGYSTPVLDRLASEGVKLEQAYANSAICSPTRTALVTGRYQYRYRAGLSEPNIRFSPGDELPLGTPTVASLLKAQGYRTALVGKWHVSQVPQYGPMAYGYDSFFGIAAGAADYFRHGHVTKDGDGQGLTEGMRPVRREGYLTDILADEAIRQIEMQGSKPLFLSLHFTAPHWPWEGPEDLEHSQTLTDMNDRTGGSLETYAKMMKRLDEAVGRVLATLDRKGMTGNTIVVFTSDNGGERYSNTWPLIGYKSELLEGGIRVPMIVRWPARIPAGSVSQQVTISMDTLPTFLAAAGAKSLPETDGMNVLPQWTGADPVDRTLFWRFNAARQEAVREGDWKYLKIGGKEHLFNVRLDPRERAEKKDVYPELFARLKAKWAAWNAGMLPYPERAASEGTVRSYADRYVPNGEERRAADRGRAETEESKEQ